MPIRFETIENLRAHMRAVKLLLERTTLPTRIACVIRDQMWISILHRFQFCDIKSEHFGVATYSLSESDIDYDINEDDGIVPQAFIKLNLMQFASQDVIDEVGGILYPGKKVVRNASTFKVDNHTEP